MSALLNSNTIAAAAAEALSVALLGLVAFSRQADLTVDPDNKDADGYQIVHGPGERVRVVRIPRERGTGHAQ